MDARRSALLCRTAAAAARGRADLLRAACAEALRAGVPLCDLQEAILQVFLFAGYPRAIVAFETLSAVAPDWTAPPVEAGPPDPEARGRELFERIYGEHSGRVLDRLEALHPELELFILRDAYGRVLGRPFLPVAERELMAVAMLGVLDLAPQLRAHVRGALNVGAAPEELDHAAAAVAEVAGAERAARTRAVVQELLGDAT
ncbi:MAG: carboxymuconolactone decarboxylase family protein, partial [Planctomycetota bacterium]